MQVHERGKMTRWRSELVPWILGGGTSRRTCVVSCRKVMRCSKGCRDRAIYDLKQSHMFWQASSLSVKRLLSKLSSGTPAFLFFFDLIIGVL